MRESFIKREGFAADVANLLTGTPVWRERLTETPVVFECELNHVRTELTFDNLLDLSERVEQMATVLHGTIAMGTAEEWNAWESLRIAARNLHSAGTWLACHDGRYNHQKYETGEDS